MKYTRTIPGTVFVLETRICSIPYSIGVFLILLLFMLGTNRTSAQDFMAWGIGVIAPGGSYQNLGTELCEGDMFKIDFDYAWGNIVSTMEYDILYDGQIAGGGSRSVFESGYWHVSGTWSWTLVASQGVHTITGIVDPDNKISGELSELNNTIVRTVVVAAAVSPAFSTISFPSNSSAMTLSFTNLAIGQPRALTSTADLLSTNGWLSVSNFTPYSRTYTNTIQTIEPMQYFKLE